MTDDTELPAFIPSLAPDQERLATTRVAELQNAPIPGGFDSVHLQQIHRHIFQDIYRDAGSFRTADDPSIPGHVQKSLDSVFDRLGRANHLKGLPPEEWVTNVSQLLTELQAIHPFTAGNDLAIKEFASELARKNALSLQWDASPEIDLETALSALAQEQQAANFRRLVMLAMDTDPTPRQSGRHAGIEHGIERLISSLL